MVCPSCKFVMTDLETSCPRCAAIASQVPSQRVPPIDRIGLVDCPACRQPVSSQASACPQCGQPIATVAPRAPNDSGTGTSAVIPDELRGFNWGALLCGFFWGIFHNSWFALLCAVPAFGIVTSIIVGLKGNEWAWQNRRWSGIEQFKKVQREWAIWGTIWFVSIVAFTAVIAYYHYTTPLPPTSD
jgi:Double zinc ribbon